MTHARLHKLIKCNADKVEENISTQDIIDVVEDEVNVVADQTVNINKSLTKICNVFGMQISFNLY